MSIYKEENNKKDCFEHLISLQDCDHNSHATTDCAVCEQDGGVRNHNSNSSHTAILFWYANKMEANTINFVDAVDLPTVG